MIWNYIKSRQKHGDIQFTKIGIYVHIVTNSLLSMTIRIRLAKIVFSSEQKIVLMEKKEKKAKFVGTLGKETKWEF